MPKSPGVVLVKCGEGTGAAALVKSSVGDKEVTLNANRAREFSIGPRSFVAVGRIGSPTVTIVNQTNEDLFVSAENLEEAPGRDTASMVDIIKPKKSFSLPKKHYVSVRM